MGSGRSRRSSSHSRRTSNASIFAASAPQANPPTGQGKILPDVHIDKSATMETSHQQTRSPSRETVLETVIVSPLYGTENDPSSNAAIGDIYERNDIMSNGPIAGRVSHVHVSAAIEQRRVPSVKDGHINPPQAINEAPEQAAVAEDGRGIVGAPMESSHAPLQNNAHSTVREASGAGEALKPVPQGHEDDTQALEAWKLCAEQVWTREELVVKKWKDEISNLLTFTTKAGLFSAALTAFNVQYYVNLQPQPLDPNTLAMLIMIGTLAQMNDGTDAMQPMIAALNASSYTPVPAHVISTNVLWFSALVLSLSAASLAISVSQWLHHHVDRAPSQSRQSVRLWYFRHSMFNEWNRMKVWCITQKRWIHTSNWRDIDDMSVRIQQENTAEALDMLAEADATVMDDALLKSAVRPCLLEVSPVAPVLPVFYRILEHRAQDVDNLTDPPTFTWSTGEQDAAANAILRETCADLLVKYLPEITGEEYRVIPLLRVFTSMIRAAPLDASRTTLDISVLQSIIRPRLMETSSVISVLPVLYEVLKCRAQDVDTSTDPPTLTWSTNVQDAAEITYLGEICIDLLYKYLREIGSGQFEPVRLLHHLASLIKYMPYDAARTTSCEIMETLRTYGPHDATWEQRRDLCAILPVSFIDAVVHPSIQPGGLPLDIAIQVYHTILRYRIHGVDYLQTSSSFQISGTDADVVTAMGSLSLEIFTRITSEVTDTTELHQQQMQTLAITHYLMRDTPRNKLSVYHHLVDLLPAPELSQKVLNKLVKLICYLTSGFRLDIGGIRRLLGFLPQAGKRLDTDVFLQITSSALLQCALLPPDDFARVHSDVRGVLDAAVEYFSLSGIIDVVQTHSWSDFRYLLGACFDLAQVIITHPVRVDSLFTQDFVNALGGCVSRGPGWWKHAMEPQMEEIYRTLGFPTIFTQPISEITTSAAQTPQEDVDEGTMEPLLAVEEPPVV
ncbi:hypothetical protein POSPLADRAFT_1158426 [Postia placenta MAD-698-R-SB12]|uniref:DUF6535 domain-containing protein n=1 Tax=Postia placenta MAD-698-R-SB12 TaxID=670580 RepID=A0A1X6MKS7_9APHY|nr:hypothetical protein POSPLADRAFT_1158426 [Postia placenta MAD-698-R-SB12]OSX57051.1 hypothetical protein POSPLADRAFT_1158426 [Postia placenta MAD-698-R-SB12]